MGRSIAKCALSKGDRIAAVGRTFETSLPAMQNYRSKSPDLARHGSPNEDGVQINGHSHSTSMTTDNTNYLGLLCDVRVPVTVQAAFDTAVSHFGHVDVIANCSGYGILGSCEDQSAAEIRNQFETNVMGTLNIIHASLPYLRERGFGRYLIFSSSSGALGVPGLGPYCASKYAVEGLVESMLYEVDGFGIRPTLVEPGHVRRDDNVSTDTQWEVEQRRLPVHGHLSVKAPSEPYATPTAPAGHARRMLHWMGDHQPTSAVKSAELVWQLAHCRYPPLRLVLGAFAIDSIRDRMRSIIEEIEDWKHLSFPADDEKSKEVNADQRSSGEGKEEDDVLFDENEEEDEELEKMETT